MAELECKLREDLCEVGRRLYNAGFMPGSSGNLSAILSENEILITPSGVSKGFLQPEDIAKIDRQGNQLEGGILPSSEKAVHLAAYEERPDIRAVAHSHPPMLIAFSVAGLNFPGGILPEIEIMFGGNVPIAPYATPGSRALADSIRPHIRNRGISAVIMDHHGLIAVGHDIYQAAIRSENAEAAAKVIFYARQLGSAKTLSSENMKELRQAYEEMIEKESSTYLGCRRTPQTYWESESSRLSTAIFDSPNEADLEKIIREAVKKAIDKD